MSRGNQAERGRPLDDSILDTVLLALIIVQVLDQAQRLACPDRRQPSVRR
jgi:hypothetical protein